MGDVNWENLPTELVSIIAHKLGCLESCMSLSGVCKEWNSAEWMKNLKLSLLTKYPLLFLAEDTGEDLRPCRVTEIEASRSELFMYGTNDDEDADGDDHKNNNDNENNHNDIQNNNEEDNDNENNHNDIQDRIICNIRDLFKNISSTRGLYSLATHKIYNLDLPEATDTLILGTNKGWLVTLGRDLEINLLHPLLRHQIPLPPMLTFPSQYKYDDDCPPQQVYNMFITKVVMSSKVATKNLHTNNLPVIMAIYGEFRKLGFTRLGDKLWTDVETSTTCFEDIVFHKQKFYAIDCRGEVFMCDIDIRGTPKCIKITSLPFEINDLLYFYLIESLCGSYIWLVIRFKKGEYFRESHESITPGNLWYYTTDFMVFKLEIQDTNIDIPTCTWTTNIKDLENEALFVGRTSSTSIASSEFIKPNNIYFTDDSLEFFLGAGGGHDMGIFDVKTSVIKPHFQGMSIHLFSPPLWYI